MHCRRDAEKQPAREGDFGDVGEGACVNLEVKPVRPIRGIGIDASHSRTPTIATPTPAAPPSVASRPLSIISCRTMRHRLAPSDVRTAISIARDDARPSNRFAMLAHAMSRTMLTAARIASHGFARWNPPSENGITLGRTFAFVAG